MTNRTFTMIKPDATEKGNTGAILEMINKAGFRIVAMKMTHLIGSKSRRILCSAQRKTILWRIS